MESCTGSYSFYVQYSIPALTPFITLNSITGSRLSFCPTEDKIAFITAENTNNVRIYDISERSVVKQFSFQEPSNNNERAPSIIRYSPDGSKLFIGCEWGSRIMDPETGAYSAQNMVIEFGAGSTPYTQGDACYINNSYILYGSTVNEAAGVFNAGSLSNYRTLLSNKEIIAVDANGGYALLGEDDEGFAYLFSTSSWSQQYTFDVNNQDVTAVALKPDGTRSAIYDDWLDGIILYNNSGHAETGRLTNGDKCYDLDWNPVHDEYLLSLQSEDGAIIWDVDEGSSNYQSAYVKASSVSCDGEVEWSGDGETFATIGGGQLKIFAPFDIEDPILVINSPPQSFNTSDENIALEGYVSDDGSIAKVVYSINGGQIIEVTLGENNTFSETIPLALGSNTIVVDAIDNVGKKTSETITGTRVEVNANRPPVVTAITPSSGNYKDNVQLNVQASDPDADDTVTKIEYQYSLDGSTNWQSIIIDESPDDGYSWPSGLNESAIYLQAKAYDGETWSTEWFGPVGSITIDNTAPSIASWQTTPSSLTSDYTGVFKVEIEFDNDLCGINASTVEFNYKISNSDYVGWDSMTQGSWYYDIPEPAEGWTAYAGEIIYYKVRCQDNAGNEFESDLQETVINTEGTPEINVQRPAGTVLADGSIDEVGDQPIGEVTLTYTIENTGSSVLTVSDITATNFDNCSNFQSTFTSNIDIDSGNSANIDISFDVDDEGAFSFDMDIENNDSDENPYDIHLSGTGIVMPTMTDQDGNVYPIVQIGDQWWMAENLKVTTYRNGEAISPTADNTEWCNTTSGAYCAYNNEESNVSTYGYLYNLYAATDSRNIAPEGWHVPTDDEWKELEIVLGVSQSAVDNTGFRGSNEGSKMADNAALWDDGNLENNAAFGEAGFSALPASYRYDNGAFNALGQHALFWSATEVNSTDAWYRYLRYNYSTVGRFSNHKYYGFSVRLVKDTETELSDGLIAYYKFDGDATDATGNFDGEAVNGAAITQNGKINSAYLFDSSNDYVRSNISLNLNDYTVAAWVYLDDAPEDDDVVFGFRNSSASDYRIILRARPDNYLYLYEVRNNSSINIGVDYSAYAGTWVHIAVTSSRNGTARLYVNGVERAQDATADQNIETAAITPFIGASNVNGSSVDYFDGTIDEVGVWARELSGEEIGELHNDGNGLQYPFDGSTPLLAEFTADQTSGIAPLTVTFTDQSTGNPTSWSWDFDGDGQEDSNQQNPSNIYILPGDYTVSLTVENAEQSDTETKTDYIAVTDITQNIPVQNGMLNLLSMNVTPTAPDAPDVFDGLVNFVVAFDDNGLYRIPPNIVFPGHPGTNTIGNVDVTEGYSLFISGSTAQTLSVTGTPVDPGSEAVSYTHLTLPTN